MTTSGGALGISSELGHHKRWEDEISRTLESLLRPGNAGIELATGTFSNQIMVSPTFRSSASSALADFAQLRQLGGQSPIADAAWLALDRLETQRGSARHGIVIVTDGFNGGNLRSLGEVRERAVADSVRIFTVHRPSGFHSRGAEDRARQMLRELSTHTNGAHFDCTLSTRDGTRCGQKQELLSTVMVAIVARLRGVAQ